MQERQDAREDEKPSYYTTQLQRLLRRADPIEGAQSLGEALLPFLLILVEACWANGVLVGLAGLDFLQTSTALLPFWGPPVLLCVALWLFRRILYQEADAAEQTGQADEHTQGRHVPAGFGLLFSVLALLDLVLIWLHLYAGTNFLLDPRWLLTLISDFLALNGHFYQMLAILAITVYFCWRASRVAQMTIEPGHVWRQMWIGLLVLFLALLLRAGVGKTNSGLDNIVLILMLPALLYCALSAHALARISFVRRSHPFGLEGNVGTQESAVLSVIGGVGLILLLVTLLGGVLFSSAFFNAWQPLWQLLGTLYGWLIQGLSLLLAVIAIPLIWLISLLASLAPHRTSPLPPPAGLGKLAPLPPVAPGSPGVELAARILLPLLIVLAMIVVLYLIVRRRARLRKRRQHASGDVHESVWSWQLFWKQFKALLATLFRRKQAQDEAAVETRGGADQATEPAVRNMRELYRALLQRAAQLGYVRRRHETPLEFQRRLNELHPTSNEPQLGLITDAYSLTRYGGGTPSSFDLDSAQRSWEELKQKWNAPS